METLDVAIVGGGPAGLTAANTLARQLHTAVVFDDNLYRNAGSSHMHMMLTWDHKDPTAFRKAARDNILENYESIQFADVGVSSITKQSDSQFKIEDNAGKTWMFRKIILAVGSGDKYPEIDGYGALWKKRIFHCLFCKGYEDRGSSSSGVLAVSPTVPAIAVHMAQNAAQLSDTVTIYTNGNNDVLEELNPMVSTLDGSKFKVETRKIKSLSSKDETSVTVAFDDGSTKEEKFLAHNPETKSQGRFVEQLGLDVTASGDIKADGPFWGTSVAGVYAVGDCSTPFKVIPSAISSGCNAAVAAASEIQAAKYTK